MKTKILIFVCLYTFVFISCIHKKKAGEREFFINGYFANAKQDMVYLEELQPRNLIRIDSTKLNEEGKFIFKRKIEQTGFYLIKLAKNNFITLLIEKGETIELSGDAEELAKTYRVSGSKGSYLLKEWNVFLRKNIESTDSLAQLLLKSQEKPNFIEIKKDLDSTYKIILTNVRAKAREFIDKNPQSLASLIVLYQFFGNKALFNEKDDFDYFEKLDKSLKIAYPNSEHIKDLDKIVTDAKKQMEELKTIEQKVAIGSLAPEINLPSTDSTMISLSSFKGKVVLIDFWASWCVPCRQQSKDLVKLYYKFKKRGFEIYGVSLDKKYEPWIDAIQRDGLFWTQVCDYKYWKSPVVNLYNIDKIPFNVLIDRNGIIVAKNLSIDALAKMVPIYLPDKKDSLKVN